MCPCDGNTFSLEEYATAIGAGRSPATAGRHFAKKEQMRYRMMMGLFGLELDKAAFQERFGVPIERGLWAELLFLRRAGAFSRDDANSLTLTPTGRYLLVAMMREFFAGVNNFRDQARDALPDAERALLFGDGGCAPGAPG